MGQFKRAFVFIIAMVVSLVVVATPSFADETSRVLVENSWRFQDGQSITPEDDSEDAGISTYSLSRLPDGVIAQGIDVSEHQGNIDWDAVKASGVDFAILRVGFGAPSFGGRVDYQFQRNISECERLGIPYGIYLYSYAWDDQQALDEASFVVANLAGHSPKLPVYYDLEDNSIIADGRQSGIASRASRFCDLVSSAGYKVGIYANLNWFNNILTDPVFNSNSLDHWIAQYNNRCDYSGKYSIWQYTCYGSVPGINGYVDMNYCYNSEILLTDEEVRARLDGLAADNRDALADGEYSVAASCSRGLVLDVYGGYGSDGTNVQMWSGNSTDGQLWRVSHDAAGYVTLTNVGSGKPLDVYGGVASRGANVQQWSANGGRNQKWVAVPSDGGFKLVSALSPSLVLDVGDGGRKGANVQLWDDNGGAFQRFDFTAAESSGARLDGLAADNRDALADGEYSVAASCSRGLVLDVYGGYGSDGTNVQMWSGNSTDGQLWRVSHDAAGYVTLTNVGSGKPLDVYGGVASRGANVQQWSANGGRNQKWVAVPSDGGFKLVSALSPSLVLDVGDGGRKGANVQLWDDNGGAFQRFDFTAAEF